MRRTGRHTASTTARGYGTAHQRERARWAPKVDAGGVDCRRCGQPIEPGRPWDLGHPDDRQGPRGPEHVRCNRVAGGRNGAAVSNAQPRKPLRRPPGTGPLKLTVVIGPPAAGKSTWVMEHAQPGDIVIDFDRLAEALTVPGGDRHDHPAPLAAVTRAARTAVIDAAIRQARTTRVYLIHSNPGTQRMADYHALGAEMITIDPGRDVVRARCKTQRPTRMFTVIDEWYRQQHTQPTTKVNSGDAGQSLPVFTFPSPTSSRQW